MKTRFLQEAKTKFSSSDSNTESSIDMQGGGITDILFGSKTGEYVSKLILDAFYRKQIVVAGYVLEHALQNNVELKFGVQDNEGKTILHWIVIYSSKIPEFKNIIIKSFEKGNAKKYVNKQDNRKNTAAHYAMYLNLDDIVNLLARNGANLALKNDEGLSIAAEEKFEKPESRTPNVFMRKENSNTGSDRSNSIDNIRRAIGNLVNSRVTRTDEDTINFSDGVPLEETAADSVARRRPFQMNAPKSRDEIELDRIMKNINMNGVHTDTADSHEIVDSFIKDYNKDRENKQEMTGGSKLITGTRRMSTYSEISMSGGEDDDDTSTTCDEEDEDCDTTSDEYNDDDDEDDDLLFGGKYASGPFRGLTV